jgi:hypothetical protein
LECKVTTFSQIPTMFLHTDNADLTDWRGFYSLRYSYCDSQAIEFAGSCIAGTVLSLFATYFVPLRTDK